jgi:thymidylate kinase
MANCAAEFEKLLQKMREFLKRNMRDEIPKPLIIEFTGSPDSGKTTLINGMDSIFRNSGFRVHRPQEGAEVFRSLSRKTPLYNLTTGTYGFVNVSSAAASRDQDIVLLDRALYDAHSWMIFWKCRNMLTENEMLEFQRFFTHSLILGYIDLCFYVICDPEEAMRRAKLDAPTIIKSGEGSYTNLKTIGELVDIFNKSYAEMKSNGKPVVLINSTNFTKPEMFDIAVEFVFETIKKRLQEKKTLY